MILSRLFVPSVMALFIFTSAISYSQDEASEQNSAELNSMGENNAEGHEGDPNDQKMPLIVVEVQPREFTLKQDLPGRISAFRTAEVRARVSGIIEKRTFEEGSSVTEGEELFLIEDESLKATYQARKADLANAEAIFNLAQATVNRYAKLRQSGTISQQEYDTHVSAAAQAKAQVEQAKANAEIARINLDYATVSAPISGRVDMAMVTEGALTSAGTTQLATIEQIDKVYVDFTRSSSEYQKLRKVLKSQESNENQVTDNRIEILFDDGSVYSEKAELEFSSMTVDPETGAITLRAVVDNPNEELLPGMFVRVRVPVSTQSNALLVPQKAVKVTGTGTVVNMIENDQLKPVPVELGEMSDSDWVVLSGLKAGDRVVVSDTTIASMMQMPVMGMTEEEQMAGHAPNGANNEAVPAENNHDSAKNNNDKNASDPEPTKASS